MSPRMIAGKKIKAILYQLVPWVYLLKTASHLSATCAQESRAQPSVPSLLRRQTRQRRSDLGVVCVSVLNPGCEDGGASTLSRLPQQWGGMRRIKKRGGGRDARGGKSVFQSLLRARTEMGCRARGMAGEVDRHDHLDLPRKRRRTAGSTPASLTLHGLLLR